MAWTAPRTWVAGQVLTAAQLNVDVRDNTGILRAHYADSVRTVLSAGTTTSGTYVDIPGTSITMSYTKRSADSRITATGHLSGWYNTSGAFPATTIGVSINGTDYDLGIINAAASVRQAISGVSNPITGIAAGAITVKLRVKVGAGTFTTDANGYGSILVNESL